MALPNIWHSRKVADNASKACWICYKPTTSVLITPDNKDFFYICTGHLKDRAFCTPDADEAAAIAKKKEMAELEKEIEDVKREYEEKIKKRKEKRKEKEKDKDKDKGKEKEEKKKDEEEDKKEEAEKEEKMKALDKKKEESKTEDGPRIFVLHKNFYQQRLDRIRNVEMAKRNRERLKNPSSFPSVPTGNP